MRIRDVGRLVCMFTLVAGSVVTAISCGGSGGATSNGHLDGSTDGTGLTFGEAGNNNNCTPKKCTDLGYTCGPNSDGCGNVIQCGSCTGTDYCGGGGYSQCGNPAFGPDGGPRMPCTPKTCADYPAGTCGAQTDGCGGLTATCAPAGADAGTLCPPPQFCGGGGPGICGSGTTDGGDAGVCTPKTCADYASGTCGPQTDGCGMLTPNCTTCVHPKFCGGDPTMPNMCGGNDGLGPDGGVVIPPCMPKTCADFPAGTCGAQGDGCNGLTAVCTEAGAPSGSLCVSPHYCGGGGTGLCGGTSGGSSSGSSGGSSSGADSGVCNPKTCAAYPSGSCGQQADGCGGLTANCGTCTNPTFCGGGTTPGTCGGNNHLNPDGSPMTTCTPATCAGKGYTCGQAGDGCGGVLSCGGTAPNWGCQPPQACGAGSKPNVCGSNIPCTGLCLQQVTCDGGVTTTLTGTVVAATLAKYLPTCASLSGAGMQPNCRAVGCTWTAAGNTCSGTPLGDPVPNVLVYVPQSAVTAFVPRAMETAAQQCSVCGADVSGNPLVQTNTSFDGTFTLSNVPVASSVPLVIQLGRWRRQFTVNIANPCAANQVNATGMPVGILKMPATKAQGDIPLTAISTGDVDAMECVLLKMGIDSTEFTTNAGTGRVQMYQGNGAVSSLGGTPAETVLMGTTTSNGTYNNYDQVILPCWGVDPTTNGSVNAKTPAELANLVTYGNAGGHFFATHFSYAWLYNNNPFNMTAAWNVNRNTGINSMTGVVSQSVPPTVPATAPGRFVQWLNYVTALSNFTPNPPPPNPADVTIANARHDVNNVLLQSVDWIDGQDPGHNNEAMLLHYTFDTPVNVASGQCGHSIFSDFHVSNSTTGNGQCNRNNNCSSNNCGGGGNCVAAQFPSQSDIATYCNTVPMTSQEKILEYMIWDLASCVPGVPVSTCTPQTCASYPAGTCGVQGDGCGGLTANCSTCPAGQTCGGCGVPGQCCAVDSGTCTPLTCASYPTGTCGQQSDGCGGLTANCNNCATGQTCGGCGVAGVCASASSCPGSSSSSSSGGCTPLTCAAYPSTCGVQSDGCGALTPDCNPCTAPQTCGGCGVPGQCCTPPSSGCTPKTCADFAGVCGVQSDGCGGVTAYCNPCTAPQTCGGCGTAGVCCGNNPCTPLTCAAQGISCGPAGDGCGNVLASCGTCPAGQTCGGCGTPGVCCPGSMCTPKTCQQLGINCGPAGDGCGNLISSCGTCTPPLTCGGGGTPGQCGMPIVH